MRLIDADKMVVNESIAYMSAQKKIDNPVTLRINSVVHRKIQQLISDTPTIDAVPVVRCRECKFRSSWMINRNLRYICPESGMFPNCENDFCSRGERKGGEA